MKRVACYVRVSTQEQKAHGQSVDSQIEALETFCKENGYFIQGIYNDAGISARKSYKKRPALLDMIRSCQLKDVDLVIFTRLDRFFRSVPDYYACIEQMQGVPWRAIWEDYETETSAGTFKVNIMLSIAQAEADRTSEKIKSVNEYRRAQGQYISGYAPTGYRVEKSKLYLDESKREAIEAFFKEYLNSFSISSATKKIQEYGIMIRMDTAKRMLKNPTYYGDAYGHKCEAVITKEQYDLIQLHVNQKSRSVTKTERVYLFTGGIFKCPECGCTMSGSFRNLQSGKTIRSYKFYRCARAQALGCNYKKSISEKRIEKMLIDNIEVALDEYNFNVETTFSKQFDNKKKIKDLESKLERIGQRFEDGDITREEYRSKRDQIKKEIDDCADISIPAQKKALPQDWRAVYDELDDSHKRAFWNNIVKEIRIDEQDHLSIIF